MASSRVLVLEALVELDHVLTNLFGNVDLLTSPTPEVIGSLRECIPLVVAAMRTLRERVLSHEDETTFEEAASVLRARASVLNVQLAELGEAEHELGPGAFENAGRFRTVVALSTFVLAEIGRATAAWLQDRHELGASGHDCPSYKARYHVAIDEAEHALVAIGRNSDVERFLRAGSNSTSQRVRTACRTIAAVLELGTILERPRRGHDIARATATDDRVGKGGT